MAERREGDRDARALFTRVLGVVCMSLGVVWGVRGGRRRREGGRACRKWKNGGTVIV